MQFLQNKANEEQKAALAARLQLFIYFIYLAKTASRLTVNKTLEWFTNNIKEAA